MSRRNLELAGALILMVGCLAACGTTDPVQAALGIWALQTVDGAPLPYDYSFTTTDGEFVHRILLADTLILTESSSESSRDRFWFDAGAGPQVNEFFVFATGAHDDSFIIHLITGTLPSYQATLEGEHLRIVIPEGFIRAGAYDYTRASSP
jgi:hypothetical protein